MREEGSHARHLFVVPVVVTLAVLVRVLGDGGSGFILT